MSSSFDPFSTDGDDVSRTTPLPYDDESEILSVPEEEKPSKRLRIEEKGSSSHGISIRIDNGLFCKIPPELFHHIFKFLSSEDLVSCSLAYRFMNSAASDECLWRRLYCLRWGMESTTGKPRECSWKKLYIQRDQDNMIEFVRNTPAEFKEYYIQMQAAKRSQTPLPSQVSDDRVILDNTVADQILSWKKSRGFIEEGVADHVCSGNTCSYTQFDGEFFAEARTPTVRRSAHEETGHAYSKTGRPKGVTPKKKKYQILILVLNIIRGAMEDRSTALDAINKEAVDLVRECTIFGFFKFALLIVMFI